MIRLTDRRGIGHVLWRIRRTIGMSPEGLAARLGMTYSAVIAHYYRALRAGDLTPDRRPT